MTESFEPRKGERTSVIERVVRRVSGLHEAIARDVPALARGMVWCRKCGASQRVNAAECLRHGWPKCCGQTMTIDAPETR